eukprot:COSAG02_NODE_55055_length_292_cov_1.569948_1_plen_59_part_10
MHTAGVLTVANIRLCIRQRRSGAWTGRCQRPATARQSSEGATSSARAMDGSVEHEQRKG